MIFLTSDEHYYHSNIIKYCNRPYSSLFEMHKDLIDRHNSFVSDNDTVYHLGDFSFNHKKITNILNHLNGTHILICGNHDEPFKKGQVAEEKYILNVVSLMLC